MTKGSVFCRNVFVIILGASGPGVRSIQKIAQWDVDLSWVGIVKDSRPCDQSAVSEGSPLELLQESSDTYPGSTPILAAHESRRVTDADLIRPCTDLVRPCTVPRLNC